MRFGRSPKQPSMPQQPQMPQQKPIPTGIKLENLREMRRPMSTMPIAPPGMPRIKPMGADMGFGQADLAKFTTLNNAMRGRPMKKGGVVKSSASKRADGIATKGKTKGRMV